MSLRVLAAGTFSLVVDGGRPQARHRGLPLGGAADRAAWMVGNALVGNSPEDAALEITLSGPTLRAEQDLGLSVFGAPFQVRVDGRPIPPGWTFSLCRGSTLEVGGTATGARAYLCIAGGGVNAPEAPGSRTAFGPIGVGELLSCRSLGVGGRSLGATNVLDLLDTAATPNLLRVLPGPQADWFDFPAVLAHPFRVTPASNRMGVRVHGVPMARRPGELASEAVAPGAVQVTNEGQCIVLGVDGQTIGGYPKVAHVINADLDVLGQLRPGTVIRFKVVTAAEAEQANLTYRSAVGKLLSRIEWAEWLNASAPNAGLV